jgi:hypothetical protein
MFGNTPAHGLLIRHAEGIEVSDFKVTAKAIDARPCFLLDDVAQVDFTNIKTNQAGDVPVFALKDVKNFSVSKCKPLADVQIAETASTKL